MNFDLKKIIWAEDATPTQPQTMSLRYRKEDDADEEANYTLVSDSLLVLENGAILNAPVIKGLADNTSYVFRLRSYADEATVVDVVYKTPDEEPVKVPERIYYTNSRMEFKDPDANFMEPFMPRNGGAYFSMRNNWYDYDGRYGRLETNSQVSTRRIADGVGFYIPANTGEMNIPDLSLFRPVNFPVRNYYAASVEFCMAAADNTGSGKFPLISCMNENGIGVFVYVDLATKKVYWEHTSDTLKETLVSVGTVNYNAWNHVGVIYPLTPDTAPCEMYLNGSNATTGTMGTKNPIRNGDYATIVNIGTTQFNKSANAGKGTFRNFAYTNSIMPEWVIPMMKMAKLDIVFTSQDANATRYLVPSTSIIDLGAGQIDFNIPENVPAGKYNVTVEYGDKISAPQEFTVQAFTRVAEERVFDFTTDVNAVATFRNNFYVMQEGSDGADGGIVADNVYIRNGMLTLEAHGDGYTGSLWGYESNGYPKTHGYDEDPKYGRHWVERVGAGVVSKDYYGYGTFRFEARLPREFGVVPTFFVSHKCLVKAQEVFANEVASKGLRATGEKDWEGIYFDMRQEFSLQMPTTDSHNTFASLADLLNYGWIRPMYVLSLDVLRVAIVNDPDPANNGTWELTKPAESRQLSGWTKISDTPHLFTQPFNNHVKIMHRLNKLGDGKGITAEPVNLDQFTAFMLPPAGKNIWDGEFHEFKIEWNGSYIIYYIDGVLIRRMNTMMPWLPGRLGMALLFPTESAEDKPWLVDESKLWQGKAPWHHQQMDIRKIHYTPLPGNMRLMGETWPMKGLRAY